MNTTTLIKLFSIVLLLSANMFAQDVPSAKEIVKQTIDRDDGEHITQTITLELIDRQGKSREQVTKSYRKYYGEEKRQVIFYQSPANVKGTGFLTFDYPDPDKEDDQWLYLPALRKTRRISASDKGDYFLGTDLTYEDIKREGKLSNTDYNYKVTRTEEVDGKKCFVIEGIPVNDKLKNELGYSKVKSWIDAELWMVRKANYLDVSGNHLKTLEVKDIKQIDGIWTAQIIHVVNHKTGHQTWFKFSDINYKSPVEDYFFTEESLVNGI
jgi:outer membrane lipoprotein-sorting protein